MAISKRRIDHLVLAVHDLEAAAQFYTRLGFSVGARNKHPWGTENRLIQFGSSFIELITVGDRLQALPPHEPGRFSFGAFVRDYLTHREGFAMVVLDSPDAKADAKRFAENGIGSFEPFFFERKGHRPDGAETHVAFSLAFAMDPPIPNASFFVCQQHFPENFWNSEFQKHSNGAMNIVAVTLAARNPAKHVDFLAEFTSASACPGADGDMTFFLAEHGSVSVKKTVCGGGLTGYAIAVPSLPQQLDLLAAANVPHSAARESIMIRAQDAFGVAITFVSAGERAEQC
ncbi:VOC family protein [Ensifer sp. SSB1]|uniref:VOC family protein n=1 Tax=Ensifer sp. SSB1 TaxID=2795385 RepID=UPI001A39093A|nr:VOC family protein [Ensifer sp. SSB1]MBK5567895.1 VOC family protein [Ensifer sp. SSB1]